MLLLLFEGASIRRSGEEMDSGWERTLVLAAGRPAGALSDAHRARRRQGPPRRLGASRTTGCRGPGGFEQAADTARRRNRVAPVTPDAFDPAAARSAAGAATRPADVLVTGDSLAQPLDAKVARAFAAAGGGVKVVRDARIGTAISKPDIVDWGRLPPRRCASGTPTRS